MKHALRLRPNFPSMVTPRHRFHRGVAAVEFALVAPLFMILVLGIAEIGRGVQTATMLSSAVREGGRLASMDWKEIVADDDTVNTKVIRDIRNFLNAAGLPGEEVTIRIVHADGNSEGETFQLADTDNYLKYCRIEATVPYVKVSTFPYRFMKNRSIDAQYVFRVGRITELIE